MIAGRRVGARPAKRQPQTLGRVATPVRARHRSRMTIDRSLSPCGQLVRRVDPDRYLTALFAPPARREALFALYAFNHELARAREVVREPFAALIRLQWWREVIEGAHRAHEVAGPVAAALDEGWLVPTDLEAMIVAREMEAEGFETLSDLETYAMGSAGGVMVTAGRALGMDSPEPLRQWGAAYGVAGILRSVGAHARQGRCLLPLDLVREAGSNQGAVLANPHAASLDGVKARLRDAARVWLEQPVSVPRPALAAALPAIIARQDVRRRSAPQARPLWDKILVIAAGLSGSIKI